MVYMYHSFLIHSSADEHLGCFHVLAMINSAAMNIGVHVSLSDLVSLVSMPRSGIAGLTSRVSGVDPEIFHFCLPPRRYCCCWSEVYTQKTIGLSCLRGKRMLRKVPGFPQRSFYIARSQDCLNLDFSNFLILLKNT